MNCACAAAGFCERYQKIQSARMVAICRGEVGTPQSCEVYRRNWAALASGWIPGRGPGSHLSRILQALGISKNAGDSCESCNEMLVQMDQWGVTGCQAHRGEILAHLEQAYRSTANLTKLRAGWAALASHLAAPFTGDAGLPLTLAGLLDEALRRAASSSSRSAT